MPKLRDLSRDKVISILEKHGFQEVRQERSHIVMMKFEMGSDGPIIVGEVMVPNYDPILVRELRFIIASSKIPREEFE